MKRAKPTQEPANERPEKNVRPAIKLKSPYKLKDYQLQTVVQTLRIENEDHPAWETDQRCAQWDIEMGLGKTLTMAALIRCTLDKQRKSGRPSLVVCPIDLISQTQSEFEKFFGSEMKVLAYYRKYMDVDRHGSDKSFLSNFDVIITNYHTVTGQSRTKKRQHDLRINKQNKIHGRATHLVDQHWFRIIIDESHNYRNPGSQQYRAMKELRTDHILCMTGTMMYNSLHDVYAQLYLMGMKKLARKRENEIMLEMLDLEKKIICLRRSDVKLTLPELKIQRVYYHMTHNGWLFYTKTERELKKLINSQCADLRRSTFRMLQMCSGAHLTTFECRKVHNPRCTGYFLNQADKFVEEEKYVDKVEKLNEESVDLDTGFESLIKVDKLDKWLLNRFGESGTKSGKMQRFVKLLKESVARGDKVVVFDQFVSPLMLAFDAVAQKDVPLAKQCVAIFGKMHCRQRDMVLKKFKCDPGYRVLFATLGTCGTGLNLTEAQTVIFLTPHFSFGLLKQAMARLHRMGQTKVVHAYFMCGSKTMEPRILDICSFRNKQANRLKSKAADKIFKSLWS